MSGSAVFDFGSDAWRDRLIDDALREGRITLVSAPDWRRRLEKAPQATENAIYGLAPAPTVAQANLKAMNDA